MTPTQVRAALAKIVAKPSTPATERIAANRLIAKLDGRLEEHDRIRAASGLGTGRPIVEHTPTSIVFRAATAEQARAHCRARGLR